jgi:hypothetical protein
MSGWRIGRDGETLHEEWDDDLWGELRDDDEGEWARDTLAYEYDDGLDD